MNAMNPEPEHPLNALTEQTTEEERKKQVYTQRALRTLESDMQEAVQERNASTASIVMAEQAKAASSPTKTQKHRPSNLSKKILVVFASVLLVVIGVGGAYYLYLRSPLAPSAPAAPKTASIASIVPPDEHNILDLTGLGSEAAKTAAKNALSSVGGAKNGSIVQIVPIEKEVGSSNENIIDAGGFITLIGLPAPDVLFRSLNDQWMLGTYNDNGTAAPFMVLTDNFFQNAYAGMITWENTMPDDFVDVFGYENKVTQQNGTSTLASYFNIQGGFKDGVIENKDVRVFAEPDGTILLLYSFVDNDTIVITTDENALAEIINRLEKQTFIR